MLFLKKYGTNAFLIFSLFVFQVSWAESKPADVSKRSLPGVVSLYRVYKKSWSNLITRLFDEPNDLVSVESPGQFDDQYFYDAMGSGFVIDSAGLILTNYHVVQGSEYVGVALTYSDYYKKTVLLGKVVGQDSLLDVALIRLEGEFNLPTLPLGDSDLTEVSDPILVMGNPMGFYSHTTTHGFIAETKRAIPSASLVNHFHQLDVSVNPGNSGGPVLNHNGEVIGVLTLGHLNFGFAVPINNVKAVLPQLKEKGYVVRGTLGADVATVTPKAAIQAKLSGKTHGVIVTSVKEESTGQKAGIVVGDIIQEVNGQAVQTSEEYYLALASVNIENPVSLKMIRNLEELSMSLPVSALPVPNLNGKSVGNTVVPIILGCFIVYFTLIHMGF